MCLIMKALKVHKMLFLHCQNIVEKESQKKVQSDSILHFPCEDKIVPISCQKCRFFIKNLYVESLKYQ